MRYKRFISDILYILESFQICWKNFGQSEWPLSNCYQIFYRNSNFVTISRDSDTRVSNSASI